MLVFIVLIAAGFAAAEVAAYLTHRFLFHGLLWPIHRTHHRHAHRHGPFELNDLFSLAAMFLGILLGTA